MQVPAAVPAPTASRMLLKFLWFLVLLWIVGRVLKSAMSIFRIASGQVEPQDPNRVQWPGAEGPVVPPAQGPEIRRKPTAATTGERRRDVEDARFEDL